MTLGTSSLPPAYNKLYADIRIFGQPAR